MTPHASNASRFPRTAAAALAALVAAPLAGAHPPDADGAHGADAPMRTWLDARQGRRYEGSLLAVRASGVTLELAGGARATIAMDDLVEDDRAVAEARLAEVRAVNLAAAEASLAASVRRTAAADSRTALLLLQDGADRLREPHFVVDALTDARDLVAAAAAGVAADAARVRGTRRAGAAAGAAALDAAARKLHFLASWARETLVASDEGSSFDRVAAGVESGAAVCSALRSAVCDVLAEQLEFARASEAVVRATHD